MGLHEMNFANPMAPVIRFEIEVRRSYPSAHEPRVLYGEVNADAVGNILRTIELRNYVGPIAGLRAIIAGDRLSLEARLKVLCRDRQTPLDLAFAETMLLYRLAQIPVGVHSFLLRATRHELEESIYVDGVRQWDPHPETAPQ